MPYPSEFGFYSTDGKTISERGIALPRFEVMALREAPEDYVADAALANAVQVAALLGQPLLVSGEPGTGKTRLAFSIAHQLDQKGLKEPLVYNTKNNSIWKDLFYQYDALRHFHDARNRVRELDARDYISYEALGLAVLLTRSPDDPQRQAVNQYLREAYRDVGPVRPVVLIDEIDKAPRDVPNDILNEIESMSFSVPETGQTFKADPPYKPIVVLTSNSEKDLPAAFLRRCVFYHIPFPSNERLRKIVERRLPRLSQDFKLRMLNQAIKLFEEIRGMPLRKKPATAELLAWVQILDRHGIDVADLTPGRLDALALSYSVLAKSKEDRDVIDRTVNGRLANAR